MKKRRSLFHLGAFAAAFMLFCGISFGQDQKYDPQYHYFPAIDPTGLFYYGGQYFLNWGAAVSNDLVHWKLTPYGVERNKQTVASFGLKRLADRTQFQNVVISQGSGSAVVDWNNTSGLGKGGNPPIIALQGRSLAYTPDTTKTWIKWTDLVLPNSTGTFRDPKVFWYEPEQKWILIMGWAEIYKIKFFSSKNLKDWEYMSEFGPWGATDGQWECADFFPLVVDGNQKNIKWVLVINNQPCSAQYFVGSFDGKQFIMDQDFINQLSYSEYLPEGDMLFNFEKGLDAWKMEGTSFINGPTEERVHGREGRRLMASGTTGTGKLTSPEFRITKSYINFLVGGDYFPGENCVNLLVDGKVVRTQSGNGGNSNMDWTGWDVSEFMGKNARIEIVDKIDNSVGTRRGWGGSIYCDAIMLCDELPRYEPYNRGWQKAFWVDWGQDYYAARAWTNYAPGETRTIWTGFMGNWRYTATEPILGIISVPRTMELKTMPEGIRLIQNPIKELETLRSVHKTALPGTFEGTWASKKFTTSKNSYELVVEFENVSAGEFGVKLCVGGDEKTIVGYSASEEAIYVDRRNSGYDEFSGVFPSVSKGPLKNRTNTVKLHIFVDNSTIEVFGNDGETTISSKIYPDTSSLGIELFSNNGKVNVKSLDMWELNSINLY
jgi:fructan beta-fructosidase